MKILTIASLEESFYNHRIAYIILGLIQFNS